MKTTLTILLLVLFSFGLASAQGNGTAANIPAPTKASVSAGESISKLTKKIVFITERAAERASKANIRALEAAESGEAVNKTDEAEHALRTAKAANIACAEAIAAAAKLKANSNDITLIEALKSARKAKKAAKTAEKAADEAFDKLIVINFKERLPPVITLGEIEEGDFFRIRIDSINHNMWKVTIGKSDSVLSKPQQTPAFGAFNLETLAKLAAGISPVSSTLSSTGVLPSFYEKMAEVSSMEVDIDVPEDHNEEIKKEIEAAQQIIKKYERQTKDLARSIDNIKLKAGLKRLNSLFSEYPENDEKPFDFKDALEGIAQSRKQVVKLATETSNSRDDYEAFSKLYAEVISNNSALADADKKIKEVYVGFSTTLPAIESSISADKSHELLSPLVAIENNKDYTYTSLPIQFMGEQTRLQLSIVPRNDALNQHSHSIPITFPTIIKKYISAGISFYSASIYDRAYSTTETFNPDDSTSTYHFDKEGVDKAELGLAAMLRYGKKKGEKNNFGYHGSIGAGISMSNKIKPRALFGGGLSFGKKHMLATDIGFIIGYVDKHNNRITKEPYNKVPNNLTVSRIGFGGFFSIGYLYQF